MIQARDPAFIEESKLVAGTPSGPRFHLDPASFEDNYFTFWGSPSFQVLSNQG